MNDLNQEQFEKTASVYEELLVPALFQEWADRLAKMDEINSSHKVLDVACGTGVLARAVARRLDEGSVTGVDLNPGMLAVARRIAPGISWFRGSAENLPFDNDTFDIVLSQFGLMLFSSPKKALKEMLRVLKTGGYMIIAVFDSIQHIPAYQVMAELFERKVSRTVGETLRFPFSMGDTKRLQSLYSEVGASNTKISSHKSLAKFKSPQQMVMSDVKGWFPFAQIHLDDETIKSIGKEAETVLKPFITSDGTVEFEVSAHVVKTQKI